MLPYKSILELSEESLVPKYLQISNEIIKNISVGIITPGSKLPGSRVLSELLKVNRRTVITAYEELAAQGWIISAPNKGSFVQDKLPEVKPRAFAEKLPVRELKKAGFYINTSSTSSTVKASNKTGLLTINDGYPDVSIAPLKELGRNFSYIMNSSLSGHLMNYRQAFKGDIVLRQELVKYLADTRSINVNVDNIMITRGSLMAFYLLFQAILDEGDIVAVGHPGYNEGYDTIKLAKGKIRYINVDDDGINTNELEIACDKESIKAVFIISHHHYPTTVSLSAARRMHLLSLAEKYQFAIIEDDYDYDFHYASSPLLPVASYDFKGHVCYVGSFSKTIAPSLRVGFIVAPENIVEQISQLSRSVDSYGNSAVERAIAMLFQSGSIKRHLKKSLQIYEERRDLFCGLLTQELGHLIEFKVPEGGLAVWIKFDKRIVSYQKLVSSCLENRLQLTSQESFLKKDEQALVTRIGFASIQENEMLEIIKRMKKSIRTTIS